MLKAAVLGAGYMGSAITYPLSENNIKVNLWGTWLDDEIIRSSLSGYHPKLKKPLPDTVTPMYSDRLADAVRDVDIIFIAVLSDGFVDVFNMLLDVIEKKDFYFFKLTKGIVQYGNRIVRASEAAKDMFEKKFPGAVFKWGTIGGPVKANELSDKIPSASVYALNKSMPKDLPFKFSAGFYPVTITDDIPGVEVSSSFKNVYSIAVGICDGIYKASRQGMYHNFSAFVFNQAVAEMSKIAVAAGGRADTVFGLAGIGDFYVASLSGRNARYGEVVGKGENPGDSFNKMFAAGEVAEGYYALKLGVEWIKSLGMDLFKDLPLLYYLYRIIFEAKEPLKTLLAFVADMKARFQSGSI
jgi:glycerol-3-phosphate dehydrogenase (NAD(P)+)